MAKTDAELKARSAEADIIIADLKAKIEKIKSMGPLPANIQETILKQENAILRKQVETLKSELTALELRNGKIQVALPKPVKATKKGAKPAEKPAPKKRRKERRSAQKTKRTKTKK